jgi:hypothetical protein
MMFIEIVLLELNMMLINCFVSFYYEFKKNDYELNGIFRILNKYLNIQYRFTFQWMDVI